ncbi:hypothetical protein M409DRAFT_65833 [Zasmidium cellare ATCC 36951]|uniref:RCC1-like domain-containing protein n=1 Tax=Zasmidium cellare ATCC 36951 TaxID=1080233 RepID=A0A6A6CPM0_ZASCE|nr:uncharacterized protein M409DRAFT_65833 [Zasmidium cellare ATCC 36951]KAF2167709.1 hypothetical protein M409DRAFT_65833 [Zasmidium cellare ATCC 36951]
MTSLTPAGLHSEAIEPKKTDDPRYSINRLYAFGSNGSGQLGIGSTSDAATPHPVNGSPGVSAAPVKHVACGGNHTVILFTNRNFAAAGHNSDGRCPTTGKTRSASLTNVQVPPDTIDSDCAEVMITATWSATLLICKSGMLMACGTGNSGELGLGPDVTTAKHPTPVEGFPPRNTSIVKLASCMGHAVAVLSTGEVYGWGKGRKGQLGEPAENSWTPRKIEGIPFCAVSAICGKDFTCIFGEPSKGELFLLGPNGNDRFGVKADAPKAVPGWKQVAASWGSIYVLFESGKLIGWGRNDHGQLPPPGMPHLESFAAGSEHCLGLTSSGKVLAWGWGEHGNCGQRTAENGDVKDRWNCIELLRAASAVFAGCATSFVVTNDRRIYEDDSPKAHSIMNT